MPAVSITPASLTFASQAVGSVSAPLAVTVQNTGNADLNITSVILSGANPSDFILGNGCTVPVAPGGTCTLQVSFAPTAGGTRTAQIELVDNAPTSPQTVSLSGSGVSASLSLSPTSLAFGGIGVGGSSTKSIKITNTGTGNLNITSLFISGSTTFTIAGHNCGAAIQPGKSCSVSIRFAPTSVTSFSATLTITSNAAGSPHTVPLSGSGK